MLQRLTRLFACGLLAALLLAPATVSAAWNPFERACQGARNSSVCSNSGADDPIAGPNGAIVNVTSILAVIAGAVSVIFLVWGGFKYITSGGDSSNVASAKNTIIAAIVGLVLALLARPIILFVVGRI